MSYYLDNNKPTKRSFVVHCMQVAKAEPYHLMKLSHFRDKQIWFSSSCSCVPVVRMSLCKVREHCSTISDSLLTLIRI